MFTYNYFVGHLKGTEFLRWCYEEASSKGNQMRIPLHAVVTMTTEVTKLEMDSTKEGSTEVTPECRRLVMLNSGFVTKRRLKLEEASSCKPQTKRRRTSKRDSSGSSGKKLPATLGCKENSRQKTMQSYYPPKS